MSEIELRYQRILKEVENAAKNSARDPSEVTVVAVSKRQPLEKIHELYRVGGREFGENRLQEALEKIEHCDESIHWHLIGSLQRKKVPKVIGRFHLIHSVDSFELAEKISDCSEQKETKTPILLQVNCSREESKHGFLAESFLSEYESLRNLPGIEIRGLMTMAPFIDQEKIVRGCFAELRQLRDKVGKEELPELSMGMSGDFHWAIAEGATIVRVGTSIFGERR
ncbi:MAG: YggS family pyridoxal phosphate-dependent enzyme [Waddliaceae bacterium]|nr:YggS family pyridoxal phosphate-dependent enzyme [Waddliaceae bacterium]